MDKPDPIGVALLLAVNNLTCFGLGICAAWLMS